MSHEANTKLFERAAEMIDACEGTLHARYIEAALDKNDLDELAHHVKNAERWVFSHNYEPNEPSLTDDQIEKIASNAWTGKNVPF